MSHVRALCRELWAAFAATTVCALVLGLVFSGVAQAHVGGDRTLGAAKVGAYALCLQHLTQKAAPTTATAHVEQAPANKRGLHKCPSCCLAASAGAAVLPDRLANGAQIDRRRAKRVAFFVASPHEPDTLPLRAAHGARAPPTGPLFS